MPSNVPGEDLVGTRRSYDAMAPVYAARWCGPGAVDDEIEYLQTLSAIAAGDAGTLVDVGCGPAVYQPLCAALGLRYIGVDFAAAMLREGAARFPSAGLLCADSRHLPLAAGSASLGVAMNSLSHMDEPGLAASISELARVIAPEGALFLSDQLGTQARVIPYPLMPQEKIPIFPRPRAAYERLLAASGFELAEVRTRAPMTGEILNDKIMLWAVRR